jgi:Flp pilus assembly protein TadB
MNDLSAVVVAGGLVGAGTWCAWTGWAPQRPPLAATLAGLGHPRVEPEPASRGTLDARVGNWARHITLVERTLATMQTDLRILHRSPEDQAAILVSYTVVGLLWAPTVTAVLWLVGISVPWLVPLWLALGGAVLGAFVALRAARAAATQRRQSFSHALSAFCDVTGMCLSAGRGVESSLQTAAATGDGWAFAELQDALLTGYVRGDTPWAALARLGADLGSDDLSELAAALHLAGAEGAAVRDTVRSKSKAIRERLTAEAERAAAGVTERMGIPATFLLLGFLVFLGYPAMAVFLES